MTGGQGRRDIIQSTYQIIHQSIHKIYPFIYPNSNPNYATSCIMDLQGEFMFQVLSLKYSRSDLI